MLERAQRKRDGRLEHVRRELARLHKRGDVLVQRHDVVQELQAGFLVRLVVKRDGRIRLNVNRQRAANVRLQDLHDLRRRHLARHHVELLRPEMLGHDFAHDAHGITQRAVHLASLFRQPQARPIALDLLRGRRFVWVG